jgi:hypothetical protein
MKNHLCLRSILILLLCGNTASIFADTQPTTFIVGDGLINIAQDKQAKTCTYQSARISTAGHPTATYDLSFLYKKNKGIFGKKSLNIDINANIAFRLDPTLNDVILQEIKFNVPQQKVFSIPVSYDAELKKGTAIITDKKSIRILQNAKALKLEFVFKGIRPKIADRLETASFSLDNLASLQGTINFCDV